MVIAARMPSLETLQIMNEAVRLMAHYREVGTEPDVMFIACIGCLHDKSPKLARQVLDEITAFGPPLH